MDANILTKDQIALLKYIGASESVTKHFYLTGGTPLAAFYFARSMASIKNLLNYARSQNK